MISCHPSSFSGILNGDNHTRVRYEYTPELYHNWNEPTSPIYASEKLCMLALFMINQNYCQACHMHEYLASV